MNLRNSRRSRLWLPVVMALAAVRPIAIAAQGHVFKSGVDMVPLTVTVTDASGTYVTGLAGGDFAVFEDGVQQPLSFFASGQVPVDVALVLDTSTSMLPSMPLVQTSAKGLIRALRSGDRGAVMAVHDSVVVPQPLTADLEHVASAIDALQAKGMTALYDGLYVTLNEFARQRRQASQVRRQVLVLLSDGLDNASHVSADDVATLASGVGVNIYVIALRDSAPRTARERDLAAERAAHELRSLAENAGGRSFHPTTATELPAIYDSIAREIASQYDLGYVPARHGGDGGFRRIAGRVLPPTRAAARTRSGYHAVRAPVHSDIGLQPVRDE